MRATRRTPFHVLLLPFLLSPLSAATLSSAKGSVELKKSGASLWTLAKAKDAVKAGDTLRTGTGASAEVKTEEGHRISLRERTTARVDAAGGGESRIFLQIGRLRAKVAKLRGGQKFEVKTPLAVASVRGTVFDVEVGEDMSSKLWVIEGKVAYKELASAAQEFLVPAGGDMSFTPPPAPADGGRTAPTPEKTLPGQRSPREGEERPRGEKVLREPAPEKGLREGLSRGRGLDEDLLAKEEKEGKETVRTASARDLLRNDLLKEDLRREILRETQFSLEKEFVQEDVARDVKQEQYQDGKALVDRLGRRVRFEEYLKRAEDGRGFTQSYLSFREGRTDEAHYTVHAHDVLPKDLREVELFRSLRGTDLKNWAEGTEWMTTSDGAYYRQWWSGGQPVTQEDPKGSWQEVIFDHGFEEIRGGEKSAPILLSHWVPTDPTSQAQRAQEDLDDVLGVVGLTPGDGGQDVPSGYSHFVDDGRFLGDDRPIESVDPSKRLAYFASSSVADDYQRSEGYARDVTALVNDKEIYLGDLTLSDRRERLDALWSKSGKRSLLSVYSVPGGEKISLQLDSYYVSDEGSTLAYGSLGSSLIGREGVHREEVYSSPYLGKDGIDVLIAPSSLKSEEKEDVPSVIVLP
jgi:hypothetical protein